MRGVVAAWVLACLLSTACNEADRLARYEVVSGAEADGGVLNCGLEAMLARKRLPAGLSKLFYDCEWPIDPLDSPDDPMWLLWTFGVTSEEQQDHLCSMTPYLAWPEPPLPLPPRKFVFCPEACETAKNWISCILRDDPCATEQDLDCSSPRFCREIRDEDAGPPPPFCQVP